MKQHKKMQDFHKPCIPFSLPLFPQKNKEKEVYD
jgi:hypothetical protein